MVVLLEVVVTHRDRLVEELSESKNTGKSDL